MNEIGGYFELELNDLGSLYHDRAIAVNTGRNALEYILSVEKYSKLYIPYFACDAILEPIRKLNIPFSFYSINEKFYPNFQFESMKENEGFIYTNYYGLCSKNIDKISLSCENLIVDNAQAAFDIPKGKIPTFYSPRKFFGVPDGGFLYSSKEIGRVLETDMSFERMDHLVGRIELGAEDFYEIYQNNEEVLKNQPIRRMSTLTKKLLGAIDYQKVKKKRRQNFKMLFRAFEHCNELDFSNNEAEVPLCYPLLVPNGAEIKVNLIKNKIFVPTYWPNVYDWSYEGSYEYKLARDLVCLPIDQRYGEIEMDRITIIVNTHLNE